MFQWLNDNIGLITSLVGLITATVGFITVYAIFRAPIVALRVQKEIETFNEQKQRGLEIFKTLLATRANTISLEHVQALNMIDVEFYSQKEISDFWNTYRDHLNSYPQNQDQSAQDRWEEKRVDYLTNLLHCMSKYFGYDFDTVTLRKGAYSPIAHGIFNLQQNLIRHGFVELLRGEKSLKVEVVENKKS